MSFADRDINASSPLLRGEKSFTQEGFILSISQLNVPSETPYSSKNDSRI